MTLLQYCLVAAMAAVLLPATTVVAFSSSEGRVFVSTPPSKFPQKLVQDFMTPVPHTVSPDTPIDQALQLFLQHGITGAPVVIWPNDENQNNDKASCLPQLVGMLSSFDFLHQEAFEGSLLPMEGSQETVTRYVHAAQRICGSTVADVMTSGVVHNHNRQTGVVEEGRLDHSTLCTVTAETPMRQAAALMTQYKLHRLPVVVSRRSSSSNNSDKNNNPEDNSLDNNNDNDDGDALYLVGMLTAEHVLQDLAHLMQSLPPASGGQEQEEEPELAP
mmetsp:Transcript_7067/g.14496  ORF Transcript_7067/g.14496 Transcript_7067/m.14496 type:complete len:274 (+) Transcript_7067:1643-2464(+)|eukprot:CAMPEP_0168791190 /NCGR_PEP_ID=MMETSP0725-20121227/13832_1 /TAXON_ID=265536 /ORGANISM="Amphiprora sp., Strain CCMP467" /LENGTH=273 /DNA_ID=CAMNT_0008841707 /DNA_START=125 /DNA_END=946 /DNA_ORIENTATION=-